MVYLGALHETWTPRCRPGSLRRGARAKALVGLRERLQKGRRGGRALQAPALADHSETAMTAMRPVAHGAVLLIQSD